MKFRTRAIHVGQEADRTTGAVVPPIYMATTFVQPQAGAATDFDYSRTANPTRRNFETTLASLEEGCGALAFASGMAATHCAMMLLKPGEHVVASSDLYGGTYRLLHNVLDPMGVKVTNVATSDLAAVEKAFTPQTKLLWVESPGNPLMSITDIAACAQLAHKRGALLAVDNTFATPVLTRPLLLGADIVMHSATKYLGGHSDVLGGALVAREPELLGRLHYVQNATGAVMAPLESYLCSRGLKTLELRVMEQSRTAAKIAEFLKGKRHVRRVLYPGLPGHPGHELAARQMEDGFGAMLSFELDGELAQARAVAEGSQLFRLAVSLGAVESLISQPAAMSHSSYEAAARAAWGISDTLIRLSVGLEAFEDLRDDLSQSIDRAFGD